MSLRVMTWVFYHSTAEPSRRVLLLALADNAHEDGGGSFQSIETLMTKTGLSRRSVQRYLRELEADALIECEGIHPQWKTRVYRVVMTEGVTVAPASERAKEGVTAGKGGRQPGAQTVNNPKEPSGDVVRVIAHYEEVFKPARALKRGPARIRGIERVLKDFDAPEVCKAIDGYWKYRQTKKGDMSLESIWKTFAGTGSMVERIQFFISVAEGSDTKSKLPSVTAGRVAYLQDDVRRGHLNRGDPAAVEKARQAEEWLRRNGIETQRTADGPVFSGTFRPTPAGPDPTQPEAG